MILVIGGSFQGKKAYAAQICKDGRILADFQDRIRAVLEETERDYREAVGHAGQMLAAAAAEVYRMQCGIAVRIK